MITVFLLTVIVLRPVHEERHPSVEFPDCETCQRRDEYCWRKGVEIVREEERRGFVLGFKCNPATR